MSQNLEFANLKESQKKNTNEAAKSGRREKNIKKDHKTFIRSLEELDQLVLLYAEFRNTNACTTKIDTNKEYREPEKP